MERRPHSTRSEPRTGESLTRFAGDMLKCQGSLARLQKRSPCWVPRSAGVGREESLPASVLCAAWRGVGSRRLGASQGPAATAFRGGSPCLAGCGGAERSSSWRNAARPSQVGKAVPGRLLGSRDGCLDWEIRLWNMHWETRTSPARFTALAPVPRTVPGNE